MDLRWRALTEQDAARAAETINAAEAVDDAGESYSEEDFAELLTASSIDPGLGSLGAFDADGRVAAFGLIFARTAADPVHEMHFWGIVHPESRRRGIGAELTRRMLPAAAAISEARFPGAPATLSASAQSSVLGQTALLESAGFTVDHYDFGMLRPLGDADRAAAPAIPDGYALAPYSAALSEEVRVTHNEAFVPDHPGSTVATEQVWAERMAVSSFRPDLSFVLRHEETGRLAGYVIAQYYEADTEATGLRDVYVHYIGTRREDRRKGVGTALLSAVLHAGALDGMDTASLGVQAENPSGALGVYRRAGFEVQREFRVYRTKIG